MWNPVICPFLSFPSFHLSFPSLLIPRSSCPVFILLFDYSGGVWSRSMRNMVKNVGLSYYQGRMSHVSSPLWPTPQEPTHTQTRLRAPTYSTAGVGDCNYCGRFTVLFQGCEASSKGHWGYRIYLTMLPHVLHVCVKYEVCVLYEVLSSGWSLSMTLPLSLLQVGL